MHDAPLNVDNRAVSQPVSALLPMLVVGFATTVVMWCVGFVTHLPAWRVPPTVVGILLLVAQLAGGFVAGRLSPMRNGLVFGLGSGLVTSLLNMLILGSLLANPTPGEGVRPNWAAIIGGYLAIGCVLGAVGATIGSAGRQPSTSDRLRWMSRFAAVAAASALPVLLSGGLVTSAEAGLAVPDWPGSYGASMFLFPLSKMTGGIYYEHAHRLFGSLVGLTVLTLMISTFVWERRTWIRLAAVIAFVIVLGQGILGGTGVTAAHDHAASVEAAAAAIPADGAPENYAAATDTTVSKTMRCIHGVTGQLTFAWLLCVAAFMSPTWMLPRDPNAPQAGALRAFTLALLLILILQLAIGAGLRHFGHVAFLHSHITVALGVLVVATLTGFRAKAVAKGVPIIRRLGSSVVHTVGLQVVLGVVTVLLVLPYNRPDPPLGIVFATAHQAIGAVLLGAATLTFVWTRKLLN